MVGCELNSRLDHRPTRYGPGGDRAGTIKRPAPVRREAVVQRAAPRAVYSRLHEAAESIDEAVARGRGRARRVSDRYDPAASSPAVGSGCRPGTERPSEARRRPDLFLYYRFGWLSRGYRIRVSMHDLPSVVFRPKDARSPQNHGSDLLSPSNLGVEPLYLHDVREVRSYVRRHVLKVGDLAISVQGCSTLHRRSNLLPPTGDRAKGVSDAYIFPIGEHHLVGLRVPFHELGCREVISLNYYVKIIQRSPP